MTEEHWPSEARPLRLSSAQSRIWIAEQRMPVGAAYVLDASLRIEGGLDADRLEGAWNRVLTAHPMLGAHVVAGADGVPRQWLPAVVPPAALERLRARDETEAMAVAEAYLDRPLDPSTGRTATAALVTVHDTLHLVVVAIHHLVGDGRFVRVVREDLVQAYADLGVDAGSAPAHAPEFGFAAIVAAERVAPAGDPVGAATARLASAPAVSTVPPDRVRRAGVDNSAWWIPLGLNRCLVQQVRDAAAARRVTPFAMYALAMHIVVQRLSGQDSSVLGFMSGNRPRQQRRAAGLHAATLAQHLDLSDDPTVDVALDRLRAELVACAREGEPALGAVAERLGSSGAVDHHPVFQAMVNYLEAGEQLHADGIVACPVVVPMRRAWLDLELRLIVMPGGGVDAVLRAPKALYDRGTVESVARALVVAAGEVATHPERAVSTLRLLDEGERAAGVSAATGPDRAVGPDLGRLIEDRFSTDHDRVAVVDGNVEWTFGDLELNSRRIAAHLEAAGIGPGDVVGVCAPRSAGLVATLTGIVRAGAAFLPLDVEQPRARHEFLLADAGARHLLLGDDLGAAPAFPVPHSVIADVLAAGGDARLPAPASDARLAYVLYTSGSTGAPKGVECTRAGLVNRLAWMRDDLGITTEDRLLQKTPYTFDVSVWEFFLPFASGAAVVVAPPDAHRDPSWIAEIIDDHRVTVVHFVPSMLRVFEQSGEFLTLPLLRHVVCSGEALPADLAARVLDQTTAEVWNLYGPTEASIDVTAHGCRRDGLPPDTATVPIGAPVANTVAVVLDPHGAVVPQGGVGELHLGGIQLADGYRGRRDLTRERFVDAPAELGGRLYRTGDLARRRSDDTVEYLGRRDRQVKLRGMRVEPAEVESALVTFDEVHEAAVGVSADGGSLIAFLDCRTPLGPAAVSTRLARILPPHLVPTTFRFLDALPRLASGKIDHNALTALGAGDASVPAPRTLTSPVGELEHRLLDVVRRVLDHDDIGVEDSFFAVGGDSLRSVELVTAAAAAGLRFTVAHVFEHPTVRQLATVVTVEVAVESSPAPPFRLVAPDERMPAGTVDALPLSSALRGLVVESARPDRYRVYVTGVTVEGPFAADRVTAAVRTVVRAQPMLRSHLWRPAVDVTPVLVVRDAVDQPVTVHDVSGTADPDAAVVRFEDDAARTPFDWFAPPLCRFDVHLLDAHRFRITLAEPFLDGYSAALVLRGVLDAMSDPAAGPGAPAPLTAALVDHVEAEQAAASDDDALRFWHDLLTDASATRLDALDRPGEVGLSAVEVTFPGEITTALEVLNRTTGTPVKSFLLAAHARAVATLCGRPDVCVGLMANGRPESAAGALVAGLFLNVTPLHLPVGDGSWWDLVDRVQEAEARTLPHRRTPYAALRREGIAPDVGTLFNFTHFRAYADDRRAREWTVTARTGSDQTYFPLTAQFHLDAIDHTLRLRVELFGAALPEHLRDAVGAVFEDAVTSAALTPDAGVGDRPLGVSGAGATPSILARPARAQDDATVVDIAEQVALCGLGAPATSGPDGALSVGELWTRVYGLAGALIEHGVQPGDPVAVELPRSSDLVVALLAALVSGGVYTPLDTGWSDTRRIAAVRAAGARVVVAHDSATGDAADVVTLAPSAHGAAPAGSRARRDAPGFLVFTSGSTGAPQPVRIPHRVVADRIDWYLRHAPLRVDDRLCARAPIGFVDSICELLTGPCSGTPVHLLADVDDPAELVRQVGDCGATRLTVVPSAIPALLAAPDAAAALSGVRRWTVSGEAFPRDTAARLLEMFPEAVVENFYGSTEVGADATWHRVTRADLAPDCGIAIGVPIDGVGVAVTDAWGHPVPAGVPGALQVAGGCVADGYVGDDERTTQRFVPARWCDGRAFDTHDIVEYDPAVGLRFLGRSDRQVKVRGVRVDVGAVEAVLRRAPGIVDVAVRDEDDTGLVAYLVATDRAEMSPAALRTHILRELPAAAVPVRFGACEQLPHTDSGKVDHRRLAADVDWLGSTAGETRLPETLVEIELEKLWTRVLGRAPASVGVDFFDLGANSLHAVMLSASAQERFGVSLTVLDVFDVPTLGGQAALIEDRVLEPA